MFFNYIPLLSSFSCNCGYTFLFAICFLVRCFFSLLQHFIVFIFLQAFVIWWIFILCIHKKILILICIMSLIYLKYCLLRYIYKSFPSQYSVSSVDSTTSHPLLSVLCEFLERCLLFSHQFFLVCCIYG